MSLIYEGAAHLFTQLTQDQIPGLVVSHSTSNSVFHSRWLYCLFALAVSEVQ